MTITLLTRDNPKLLKGMKKGYLPAALHLAPHKLAKIRGFNVCGHATPGCIDLCLNRAGQGGICDEVQEARAERTRFFYDDRRHFLDRLFTEVQTHIRYARARGFTPCFRPNATSDLHWEEIAPDLFQVDPRVQFYDYTKDPERMDRFLRSDLLHGPGKYHLTFSRSEKNHIDCHKFLARGGNVAVVFDTKKGEELPKEWEGWETVDGDQHDLTFKWEPGSVLALRFKHSRGIKGGYTFKEALRRGLRSGFVLPTTP